MIKKAIVSMMLSVSLLSGVVSMPSFGLETMRVEAAFNAPSYKQSDRNWGSDEMVKGKTISSIGCTMTDVAMALAQRGIKIDGKLITPKTLNVLLKSKGGYTADGDLIWDVLLKNFSEIQTFERLTTQKSLSSQQIRDYLDNGRTAVIVDIGGHFVLLTSYDRNNKEQFYVNDPGSSSRTTIEYSDIIGYRVLKFKASSSPLPY